MSGVPTHRVKVGEPIGQIWGWKVLDITEDGKWIYEDQNGNAVESKDVKIEDRKVIGNGLPKHYLGWNNDFRYKNFDLSVTMRGAFGFQNINFTRLHYENYRDQAMRMAIIGKLIILYWGIISRKTLLKGLRECVCISLFKTL